MHCTRSSSPGRFLIISFKARCQLRHPMRPRFRVYASDPLTPVERSQLDRLVAPHIPPNIFPSVRAALMNDLAHAVARAKPSPDLPLAVARDRRINRRVGSQRWRSVTSGKQPLLPLQQSSPPSRLQSKPRSRGRPSDTWKSVLFWDVQSALRRAGLIHKRGWKTGFETRLTRIYRACASASGARMVGRLHGVYENAKKISPH